ncbi:hypothetical protein [Pseudomonas lactucae]|nr:hypothetical protein PFWH6_2039 [Pseudomonas fluorescens WH6]
MTIRFKLEQTLVAEKKRMELLIVAEMLLCRAAPIALESMTRHYR